jgi:hypothetical protein
MIPACGTETSGLGLAIGLVFVVLRVWPATRSKDAETATEIEQRRRRDDPVPGPIRRTGSRPTVITPPPGSEMDAQN